MNEYEQKTMGTWNKAIEAVRQKEDTRVIHDYWIDKAGGVMANCMLDEKAYIANNRALTLAKMELTALVASTTYDVWKSLIVKNGGQDAARLYDLIDRKVLPLSNEERQTWIQEKRPLPIGYSLASDLSLQKVSRDFKTVGEEFVAEQKKGEFFVAELAKTAVAQGLDNDELLSIKGLARTHSTLPVVEKDKVSFASSSAHAKVVVSIVRNDVGEYTLIKEPPSIAQALIEHARTRASPTDPVPVQSVSQAMDRVAALIENHRATVQASPLRFKPA